MFRVVARHPDSAHVDHRWAQFGPTSDEKPSQAEASKHAPGAYDVKVQELVDNGDGTSTWKDRK